MRDCWMIDDVSRGERQQMGLDLEGFLYVFELTLVDVHHCFVRQIQRFLGLYDD